ncbi:MAG: HIT family protein [Chloroflexota bacterium]
MTDCIFCDIVHGRGACSPVYEDETCFVFMDIHPVNAGHLLVVPKVHATDLSDLPPETGGKMFPVAQKMTAALANSGLRCEGVDLLMAHKSAAGQEVFHAHLHVIPRYRGDGFRFDVSYDYKPSRDDLDQTAAQIKRFL